MPLIRFVKGKGWHFFDKNYIDINSRVFEVCLIRKDKVMLNNFDYMKATQILNYLARRLGGEIDKLKAIKLIYLADKYHLRKFGRLISEDQYIAMEYGPVQSGVKDIADFSDFLGDQEKEYASRFIVKEGNNIRSINEIEYEELSETDIEALDFIIEKFGWDDNFDLVKITHRGYEWKKHEDELKLKSRVDMDVLDFFEDSKNDGISKITKDTKEAARIIYEEDMEVNAILK